MKTNKCLLTNVHLLNDFFIPTCPNIIPNYFIIIILFYL